MTFPERSSQEGFALVAAVGLVVVGGFALSLLWNIGARERASVVGDLESAQALYIAQAGLEVAQTMPSAERKTFSFAGGTVTLAYADDRVTATAEYRGRKRRVSIAFKSSGLAAPR